MLLLLLRSLQRDSDKKNLILTFTFLLHPRLLLPSPCHDQENSFFISLLLLLRHDQKKKIIIIWLLLPWPEVKSFFFRLVATFNTPWSQEKKFDFYCTTTLITLRQWKKCSFLFHWDVHYGNVFLHDLTSTCYAHTSLTCQKNSEMIDSPKKTCNLKTFFLTNISGVLRDLLPFNSIWSKFFLASSKSKKQCRMTLKFSTRETERLQTKTLLKIFLLFIFLIVINPVRIKNLFFSGVTDENIKNGTVLTKF